jgi:hypothetical protein
LGPNLNKNLSEYLNSANTSVNVFVRMEKDRINRTHREFVDESSEYLKSNNIIKHKRRKFQNEFYDPVSNS